MTTTSTVVALRPHVTRALLPQQATAMVLDGCTDHATTRTYICMTSLTYGYIGFHDLFGAQYTHQAGDAPHPSVTELRHCDVKLCVRRSIPHDSKWALLLYEDFESCCACVALHSVTHAKQVKKGWCSLGDCKLGQPQSVSGRRIKTVEWKTIMTP